MRHLPSCNDSGQTWLIIADTPVQIANAIVFSSGDPVRPDDIVDMLVYAQFSGAKELVAALKRSKIFRYVGLVEPLHLAKNKYRARILSDLFMADEALRRKRGSKFKQLPLEHYDNLACSVPTYLALEAKRVLAINSIFFFEDGTGSYSNGIFNGLQVMDKFGDEIIKLHWYAKIAKKIVGALTGDRGVYRPKGLYLYSPELAKPSICPIKKLEISDQAKETIFEVWGSSSDKKYQASVIVFLDQPIMPPPLGSKAMKDIGDLMQSFDSNYIFRQHPRSSALPETVKDHLDLALQLWEVLCLRGIISGRNILIAYFSSAQFAPCLLTGEEPYLLFLYPMDKALEKEVRSRFDEQVEKLKQKYQDPRRIYKIHDIKHLEEALAEIFQID